MLKKTIANIFYVIGFCLMILGIISASVWYLSSGDDESRTNLITAFSTFSMSIVSLIFGLWKSTEPVRDYIRQLQKIKKEMRLYKTTSALTFLEDATNAIQINENLSQSQRKELLADSQFITALCRSDLGAGEEIYELFISAYKMNSKSDILKSRACTSYFALGAKEKSNEIANELLQSDEFNPRALVIKCLLGERKYGDLSSFIQKDSDFLNVYLNYLYRDNLKEQIDFIIEQQESRAIPTSITYDNIRYWSFRVLYAVEKTHFANLSLVKTQENFPNRETIEWAYEVCSKILLEVKETDLFQNEYFQQFETIFYFLEYTLHNKKDSVIRLYEIYKGNSKRFSKGSFIQLITNLSQVEEYDKILELCSDPEIIKDNDLEFVVGHTYVLKGDAKSSIDYFKDYRKKYEFVKYDIGNFRVISRIFAEQKIDPVNYFDSNLDSKKFESKYVHSLCKICFYSSDPSKRDYCFEEIEKLLNSGQSFDDYMNMNIAILLYELGYYNENVSFMSSFIDKSSESHGLYLYIRCLYLSESNHEELLKLLQFWRVSKFSAIPIFYWYEATLYLELRDYDSALEVGKQALSLFGYQGDFLFTSIYSLYRLEKFQDLESYLDNRLLDVKFTWNQIINIASICFNQNKTLLGLEIMYPIVIKTSNRTIKMQYYGLVSTGILNDTEVENLKSVIPPCLVRVEIEKDEVRDIEIQDDEVLRDEFYEPLIGKDIGDIVILKAKNETVKVEVINIFNKHQALHLKITKEFDDNLGAKAYGVKTIKGGKSPEDLINQIIDAVGDDGYKRKVSIENDFKLYRQSKLSLGNLIRRVNIGKAFQIIEQLMLDNVNGYNSPPLSIFKLNPFDEQVEFVVDLSSLFGLIRLAEQGLLPKVKFLVSRHLVDYLDELLKEESNPNTAGILNATLDSVSTHKITEEERNYSTKKIGKVISWVKSHCEIAYSVRKLDLFRKGEDGIDVIDWHQHYMMDILVLASESNRFLVTDDAFFYDKIFQSIRRVSLEFLMVQMLQDDEKIILMKLALLEINYNGLTIHHDVLNTIFDKGVILESSSNLFNKALKNLPFSRHQNTTVLFELVKHAKYIYSHSISIEFKKKLCQTLFVEALKGYPYDPNLTNRLIDAVNREFDLLGDAKLSVLDDVNTARSILGITNQNK